MFADRVIEFGYKFGGRLNADLLQGALGYVAYNEEGLAFEILCAHICEFDISITDEKYQEAVRLITDLGLNLDGGPFKHLMGLRK